MTMTITQSGFGRSSAPNKASSAPYYAALCLIAVTIVVTAVFTKTSRFADYDTYTFYIDNLVHFPSWDWLKLEPLSNIYLWICYWLSLDVLSTNDLAHTILLISFPLLLWVSFRPAATPWPALLAILGLFGPLLAFVTLRATPAYLIATWAVYEASAQRRRAFLLIVFALGFHFSAIMAIPPLLMLYFRDRLPKWARFERPGMLLLLGATTIAAVFTFANTLAGAALSYLENIPFLSKYVVYSASYNEKLQTSLNHYIFLGISSTFLIAYLLMAKEEARRLNIYIVSSYLVYVGLFLAASPVAAFRQTPFWILPMIGTFPWHRLAIKGPVALLFLLACEAMFIVQVDSVYL